MKNQIEDSTTHANTNAENDGGVIGAIPMKEVTFLLPAHIADFIEATRGQLVGQWEDWATSAAQQAVNSGSFETCVREFESLLVDSNWEFDGTDDRAQFMKPLLKALKVAYTQHHSAD